VPAAAARADVVRCQLTLSGHARRDNSTLRKSLVPGPVVTGSSEIRPASIREIGNRSAAAPIATVRRQLVKAASGARSGGSRSAAR